MNQSPNILFIMADQWRFDYLGCYADAPVRTPNLDRLAAQGTCFTHCVSNSTVCAPARIALASGLNPDRIGCISNHCFLPAHCRTYYQRLRDADYRVGVVGKLDLAKPHRHNGLDGQRPSVFRWGFTHPLEVEGKMHAGIHPGTVLGPYNAYLHERGSMDRFKDDYGRRQAMGWVGANWDSVLDEHDHEDGYIAQQAKQWIEDIPKDFPWHLFVSFVGPHDPFDPPSSFAERWRDAEVPPPVAHDHDLADRPAWIKRRQCHLDDEATMTNRRQYCASIEYIDHAIGTVLDALEASGQADHTYIVFSSDHGEMLGDLGLWQKHVPYDPSARVPLLVSGPSILPGQRSDALVSLFDCNATICEWAGLPPQADIDARSFHAVASGAASTHREACYFVEGPFAAVRSATHLYVRHQGNGEECYDMRSDPHCLHNIHSDVPEVVTDHQQLLGNLKLEGTWNR